MVCALPHRSLRLPELTTTSFFLFPSLHSSLFSPFPPPLHFIPPCPSWLCTWVSLHPCRFRPGRGLSVSSPHLPPSPIQPSSTEMDGPTMTCRHPAHTAHGIQLFYPPDQQLCASVPWTPTPAAPGNPNTCATPVSPSAPSPHPPENRLTPRTLRNHSPFRTMHKQTVSWDHHPTTPPLYSPFVPFASGITDTACRSYNAQPGEPGTTNTTPTVRGSTKPYTSGTAAPPYVCSLWQ